MTIDLSQYKIRKAGDPVELGTALGNGQEPSVRWGRLVGILKQTKRMPYIVREYKEDDGWIPTGDYRRTAFAIPWTGKYLSLAHEREAIRAMVREGRRR